MTTEQKEEINARRRAKDRAKRNSLAPEKKEEINEIRRAAKQPTPTEENRARRRKNATARRDTPCAESIAMTCPNRASLLTSTPDYTIRTDGNTTIFKNLLMSWFIKALYLPDQ